MNFANDLVSVDFTINDSSATAVDADSLPTGTLVRDGVDTAVVVTVTNKATGVYNASFTVPADAVQGNVFQIRTSALLATFAIKAIVYTEVIGGPYADLLLNLDFTTQDNAGTAKDADTLPAAFLAENAVDLPASVTVTNKETGVYTAQVRIPLELKLGDEIQIRAEATVDGALGKDNIYLATMAVLEQTVVIVRSYADVIFADDYFSRKLHVQPWEEATVDQQRRALEEATLRMDRLNFRGKKTDCDQVLEWPRTNANFDTTIIPEILRIANCEVAIALLDGVDPDLEHENLAAVAEGYSSVRSTYSRTTVPEHFAAGIPSHLAWLHLRPLLASGRAIRLRRV